MVKGGPIRKRLALIVEPRSAIDAPRAVAKDYGTKVCAAYPSLCTQSPGTLVDAVRPLGRDAHGPHQRKEALAS
jgi:hypothetical protein